MNMTRRIFFTALLLLSGCTNNTFYNDAPNEGKHLFILSGQSNMWILDPNLSFTPALQEKFGKDNIIVVKDAEGDQVIYKWYKKWSMPDIDWLKETGQLYDRLMGQVYPAIENQPIKTITFVWMQGESDAKRGYGSVYEKSLQGLYRQLQDDLHRKDIDFVIGRLSDYDLPNERFRDWTTVREAQVKVAESNKRFCWIDTDDLNDGINEPGRKKDNDLHYSAEGLKTLGSRFADCAIRLIETQGQ